MFQKAPRVPWQRAYTDRWYFSRPDWTDGTTRFHEICRDTLSLTGHKHTPALLEIGSGSANPSSEFLATLGNLTGVDTDSAVMGNPALRTALTFDGETLPFENCSFDACFSNWVIEHIQRPQSHLLEVKRVLKPGGHYVARTPNRYHYVTQIAAVTPHWFHKLVANRLRALPKATHEPWPTYYRLNTRKMALETATTAGLDVEAIHMIESEPFYGMASRLLFLSFMSYERLVNSSTRLAGLRHTMILVFRKPEHGVESAAV